MTEEQAKGAEEVAGVRGDSEDTPCCPDGHSPGGVGLRLLVTASGG